MSTFDDFVPSPSQLPEALAERGLTGKLTVERWVVLAISGLVVERRSFRDAVEVSEQSYATLKRDVAPSPRLDASRPISWRRVPDEERDRKVQRCSGCVVSKGRQICARCGGPGYWAVTVLPSCDVCDHGYVTCQTCAGTARTVALSMEYGEDRPRSYSHLFVPEIPVALLQNVQAFLRSQPAAPSALEVQLEEDFRGADAYRGHGHSLQYRGHDAGRALERAKIYLQRIGTLPTVVAERHEVFAWPLALLRVPNSDRAAVMMCDCSARAHVV